MKGLLLILPMKEEKLSLLLLRFHLKISSFQIQLLKGCLMKSNGYKNQTVNKAYLTSPNLT
jgi:hypothetical protein